MYIDPRRRKLPPIRQVPPFLILGQVACPVNIIKRLGGRRPQDPLILKIHCGKFHFGAPSHSVICSEHAFDPGVKPLEIDK